ncbi:MAG: hypothetical protein K8S98_15975, partial [Planctomycetes bacterium]|nr:hypothetical protein [Planctomycetota bacterium]
SRRDFERADGVFDEAVSLAVWRDERAQDDWRPPWELCVSLTLQAVAAAAREQWTKSLALAERASDAGDTTLRRMGASMIPSVASHRIEFAARSLEALDHATLPVDAATARGVLAFATRMAETARDDLATIVPSPKDEELHRTLVDRSRLALASAEELSRRYEPPRD